MSDGPTDSSRIIDRALRAMRLDPALYDEVGGDPGTSGDALALVVAASLAAAAGSGLAGGLPAAAMEVLLSVASWFLWAALSIAIARRVLPTPRADADLPRVLRATGWAATPGLLRLAGIVPELRELAFLVSGGWMIATLVVALRETLGCGSTGRAVGVFLLVLLAQAMVAVPLVLVLGPG